MASRRAQFLYCATAPFRGEAIVGEQGYERTIELLLRDLATTVGEGHQEFVLLRATEVRDFGQEGPDEQLVDDVQQYLHDTFVDTVWPACPRHPNHPLWFHDGAWWCQEDDVRVAELGGLKDIG